MRIGDFDHSDPGSERRPSITIENWRAMHRGVLGDNAAGRDFRAHIAPALPLFHIWDDHDYGANNADRTAWWKDLSTQAFKEYYPLPPLPNPQGGLWYSFRYGQTEVFVLDLRSQRDPDAEPDGPGKSMLNGGDIPNDQKSWLLAGLRASPARWKFIISSSAWNPTVDKSDSWHNYFEEQNELVRFIQDNGISGVILLSGDLHSGGAIDDGTHSYFPELSVPTTNIHGHAECTGGNCGVWNQGLVTGLDPAGYALVIVEHDEATGDDRVILQAKGEDGSLRLEYTITLL